MLGFFTLEATIVRLITKAERPKQPPVNYSLEMGFLRGSRAYQQQVRINTLSKSLEALLTIINDPEKSNKEKLTAKGHILIQLNSCYDTDRAELMERNPDAAKIYKQWRERAAEHCATTAPRHLRKL